MPLESWLGLGAALGTTCPMQGGQGGWGRVGGPCWGRSWGAFAMMLPCWGGRRAVAQGVTFWHTGGFCWDMELVAPALVMLCCPQLFGEDSPSCAGVPRAVPPTASGAAWPLPCARLGGSSGILSGHTAAPVPCVQPHGCCPELLSPLPRRALELCLHREVLPSRPCPAHRGHHQVRTTGLLPRESPDCSRGHQVPSQGAPDC